MRIRKIAFSIIYLIIVSCAVQVAPKGGPKDINPPEVLTESPKNESINFNAKEIVIKFNEFIQLNDIHNKMIISPPIEPFPEISIKKKSIVIKIEEKLEDSTTYKFQFGESVIDITERNPLKNFNYVIGTGNEIDSLRIRGKIKDVYRDENEKKIKVLLYIAGNDSSIYNEKPKYFSKTTEDGSFEITNIKEGQYNIFALQDKNENYKYDFGEKVGFTNKSIELVKDTNIGEIKIFAEQVFYSNVISVELTRMDLIAFKFSKLPDSFRIFQLIENEYKEIKNVDYDEIGDSLFCWIEEQDSLVFKYSVNGGLMDTLILFKENETANSLKKLKIKTTIDIYGNKFINFKTNRPLKKINKNRIKILEDSNSFKDNFEIKKLGRSISNYEFHFKVKKGKRYNIIMADSCFKSDNNSYNDTVAFGFSVMKEEELGIINLDLKKGIKKNIIVELIDSKDKLVRKRIIKNTQQITFDFLKVGSYKIRFIIDENSNGKWDTGELNKRKQAERVLYFDKTIELKANWELTEEFEISD